MCSTTLLPTLAATALLLAAAFRAEAAPAEGLYQTRDGAGFDGRGMKPPAGNVLAGSATYGTTTLCSVQGQEVESHFSPPSECRFLHSSTATRRPAASASPGTRSTKSASS